MIWSWSSRCSNTYWHVKKNAPMASGRKNNGSRISLLRMRISLFCNTEILKLYQARNDFIFSHFNHHPHQTVTLLIFKLHLTNEYCEVWSHGRCSTLRWSINHYSIASDRSSTRMRWWHRICYMAHVCTSLSCHHTYVLIPFVSAFRSHLEPKLLYLRFRNNLLIFILQQTYLRSSLDL